MSATDIKCKRIEEGTVLSQTEPFDYKQLRVSFGESLGDLKVEVSFDDGQTFVPYDPEIP